MTAVEKLVGGGHPRADAQRNVERLVAAARAALAEVGTGVTAHEIARRADVGIGTFYRRVESREALVAVVLGELIADAVAEADRLLGDGDPWAALSEFAVTFVRMRAANVAVSEAVVGQCGFAPEDALTELRERFRVLVERAQEAGSMRTDIAWQDVPFLLASVATDTTTLGLRASGEQWERNLRVILDGMRTPAPGPLPGRPPGTVFGLPGTNGPARRPRRASRPAEAGTRVVGDLNIA
jgi:AcrR family transcriptional regulator